MRRSKRHDGAVPGSIVSTSLVMRREMEATARRGPTEREVHLAPELYGAVKLAAKMRRSVRKEEEVMDHEDLS